MSRRIGILSLLCLICGGLVSWMIFPHPANGFPEPSITSEISAVQCPAAKTIPPPPPQRGDGIFDFYQGNKSEQTIQSALVDPRGVEIEFIDTPLKDAMEFVADAHEITILIDEQALTEEGIAIDEPINRTLSGIKLESALKIILEPLKSTYIIEDEVLKITTTKAANEKRSTRVYSTGYLRQIGVEAEALGKMLQNVVSPGEWRTNRQPQKVEANAENQLEFRDDLGIVSIRDPKTGKTVFDVNDKKNGIEVVGDMLVVSAPKDVHDQIQGLLMQLDRRWELEHGKK